MSAALASILILFFVVVVSGFQRVNVGLLALSMAWILGFFLEHLPASEIAAGFPSSMFIVLVAISYFFGVASLNGTLQRLAQMMMGLARGREIFFPLIFFALALLLSTLGAGNIGTVVLLAPMAIAIVDKTGLGAFFMTVMLVNGANAGTFSPFAFTGIIANSLITKHGIAMNPWTQIYLPSFFAQTFIALVSYFIFVSFVKKQNLLKSFSPEVRSSSSWTPPQILTLGAIIILIIGVIIFKADVGFLAMFLAVLLTLLGAANGDEVLKSIHWNVIIMVCGISNLIAIVEQAGGMHLLTEWIARFANPGNVTAILAFIAGTTSLFSSSSAVVMPTFIPLVPQLIERMGEGNPVALVTAVNVGSHVVDVSPFSTLGAICMASTAAGMKNRKLFGQLMLYGFSMAFFGALVCHLFFGR